jgi:hypothetical protein
MSKQEELTKLSILPVNKTVVFYSPIEGRDVLVRSGTITEGSCIFHAVLHACSKEYSQMDKHGRIKLTNKLRASLGSKLDYKRWEEASNSIVAKIPFQENVLAMITDFYRYITKNKSGKSSLGRHLIRNIDDKSKQAYEIVCDILTFEDFDKTILPKSYDECSDQNIKACRKVIIDNTQTLLKKGFDSLDNINEAKYCIDKTMTLIETILEESEEHAFKDHIKNLKDTSVTVDTYTINLIADRFNRDIYILDSRTRMPYKLSDDHIAKKRKSIIIMWLGGVHYEVVGRLLPGNRIQREFYLDDPLIKKIHTFVYYPENISDQYPQLIPYLSKEQRDKIGFNDETDSRSYESSNDSDSVESSESESQHSESRSESRSRSRSESHSESRSRSRTKHVKRRA